RAEPVGGVGQPPQGGGDERDPDRGGADPARLAAETRIGTPMDASLLQAIQAEPRDRSGWLILSDWLEEEGRPDEAELVRLREALTQDVRSGAERDARESRLRQLLLATVPPPAAIRTGKLHKQVTISFSLIPP